MHSWCYHQQFVAFFKKKIYTTKSNRFYVCSVIDQQKTSKCAKKISDAPAVSLMLLLHFDILCDLLLNRIYLSNGVV